MHSLAIQFLSQNWLTADRPRRRNPYWANPWRHRVSQFNMASAGRKDFSPKLGLCLTISLCRHIGERYVLFQGAGAGGGILDLGPARQPSFLGPSTAAARGEQFPATGLRCQHQPASNSGDVPLVMELLGVGPS